MSNYDQSDSFTRNPEVVNANQLRPHNLALGNVLLPENLYENNRAAQIRPSNPSVANLLAPTAQPMGGPVLPTDRPDNVHLDEIEGGSLRSFAKGFKKGFREVGKIGLKLAPLAPLII